MQKVRMIDMRNTFERLGAPLTRRSLIGLAAAGSASLVAGCAPEINRRGYYAKAGALSQVSEGMPKTEVEALLGSPSTTASVNYSGDSYYYISSTTQGRAFLAPVETNREIVAVRFDQQDQVASVAQYGLEDGRIFNINDRKTPVAGSELSILKELFRPVAKTGPSQNVSKRKL